LTRLRYVLFAAVLAVCLLPSAALAQTAANIAVVQGSGQAICDGCPMTALPYFDPLIVLVTDTNGNPVPGATITWTAIGGTFAGNSTTTTTTGSASIASGGVLCNAYNSTEAELAGASCVTFAEAAPASTVVGDLFDTVTAAIPNGSSVTFYLTQYPNAVANSSNTNYINVSVASSPIQPATEITGSANSVYTGGSIQVTATTIGGTPIGNVSVRLIPQSEAQTGSSISCQSQSNPNADAGYPGYPPNYPGTTQAVMTNSSGVATCTPVFGPGSSSTAMNFDVLVGGVPFLQNPSSVNNFNNGLSNPAGAAEFGPFPVLATPVTPGALTIVTGNSQTAMQGTAVPLPLTVEVTDTNKNPLQGITVTWSVSPAGAATLVPASGPTAANGQASTVVTLGATASGTVTVTATAGSLTPVSFTITATTPAPTITGLTYVSGNNQTAAVGQPFSLPLVVQVTPATSGVTVNFAVTGGSGVLSNTTQTTGSNGQASIGVTAGSTAGTLTVVASVTGISQTVSFTLTISPPAPQITATSFLNGAGFFPTSGANQTALSPCGVATLVVGSPLTTAAFPATPNMYTAPLQQTNNISITFPSSATSGSSTAPLLNITTAVTSQQLITFQVPCDATPSAATVTVSINGSSVPVPGVTVRPAAPGIFQMTGSDGVNRAVAVRPDGSVVSPSNPARQGETVRIYITGVGPLVPALVSGALPVPTPGVVSVPETGTVVIVAVYAPSGSPTGLGGVTVQASPDLIGVDEVTFTVPSVPAVQVGDNILALGVIAEGNPVQFQQPGGSILPIM
jgi:adhesin/invasin